MTLYQLAVFLVVVLVAGLIAVPRLIAYVARFKSNEMLLITVLGLCFGVSLLALKLGYSVALGAFLIGAVVAEAREIHRIEALVEPIRDMFSAVFFVSIGLLIDPRILLNHWLPVLVITFAVVAGKVMSCSIGAFMGGNDERTSLRVGMGLAQIGEFSFIIASLGLSLNATSKFLYPIAVAVSAITTLLTPYLIQSSDRLVALFDRLAPPALVNSLRVYTRWVGKLGTQSHPDMARKLVRRWSLQMALNATLIAGVFIAALFLAQHPPDALRGLSSRSVSLTTVLWVLAVLLSLPLLIATSRKLQALGLLLAETRVAPNAAGERTPAIRAIVSQLVPIVGTVILGVYVLALSSTLLPPFGVMIALLFGLGLVAWFLRRSFVRLYSKAQFALQETLQERPLEPEPPSSLPQLLREADLETFVLASGSPGAGKLIRELSLRTLTGASIVGIERDGASIINPAPDEELKPADRLLVLGTRAQLDRARALMRIDADSTDRHASGR
jgi:CPA2 family monovalent cation:H+ antiporter-2